MSEGCQIELRLIVLAITEKDVSTELRCVTQNQAGRQEVVTHLQLEGKTEVSFLTLWSFQWVPKLLQMATGYRINAKTTRNCPNLHRKILYLKTNQT